ncbi:MAG: hypothetical protein IJG87_01485 [Ruminococcus sp.]|nr:hypothetical protein [Ruminococcus sp.]
MLKCLLRDVNGEERIFPGLLSLQVNVDEGVPADSLYASFSYTATEQLVGITLYDDDTPLFAGVVDEEERYRDATGEYLRISARSLAAHLLDNEAMPCSYDHPSLGLICERYVNPYGISLSSRDDAVYFGEQNVTKGSSCWRVLKNFCTACYSAVPRISSVGVLYPKGIRKTERILFGKEGVRFTSIREVRKRCEEISTVYVKASNTGTYSLPVENPGATERGVRRVRYLNAVLPESPMRCADAMIKNSDKKSYELHLECPSCLLGKEGCRAAIKDTSFKDRNDLYISAVHYRMTQDGESSSITLKRRQDDVDQ